MISIEILHTITKVGSKNVTILIIYSQGNWGLNLLHDFFKITQQVRDRVRNRSQDSKFSALTIRLLYHASNMWLVLNHFK